MDRNSGIAENGGARERHLFTNIDEEVDKLVKEKAALQGGLAEIIA